MSYSQWIRTTTRRRIYERDGWRCVWCGCDLRFASQYERTLDHVLPRSRGGSNKAHNLVTACRRDNDARSDVSAIEYAYRISGYRQGRTDRPGRLIARRAGVILARLLDAVCAELPAARKTDPQIGLAAE
jgi:hypothetical protein